MNMNIEQELFCLKLESKSLADIVLRKEAERLVPNYTLPRMEHDHMLRYKLATSYTNGKDVLDIACGTGYGSYYISQKGNPKSIIGGDISKDSIRYAKHRYFDEKITFLEQNVMNIAIPHNVDVIISFETIEHVDDYNKMLNSMDSILNNNGKILISTPISDTEINLKPINPYHKFEWGFEKFHEIISNKFQIEDVYVQLFQNSFLNDEILSKYYERRSKLNLRQRIRSRLNKILTGQKDLPKLHTDFNNPSNFSKIEKYTGQYRVTDLGTKYIGYQIVVCNKIHK